MVAPVLAAIDMSSAIAAEAAGAASSFQTNLGAVIALVLPIIVGGLVVRRVLRFVK